MDIFKTVKANVTTRQAAEYYSLQVKRNGMTCCPFHPDKHPSMKLDERYYCFGCHVTGDVIDFVAKLHGIGKLDAARRLAEDFHLEYDKPAPHSRGKPPPTPEQRRERLMQKTRRAFMVWRDNAISTLYAYDRFLEEQKERYTPATRDAEWCKPFIAALREKDTVALYLHILQEEPLEEQNSFYMGGAPRFAESSRRQSLSDQLCQGQSCLQAKERIAEFEKQMEQYRQADDGRTGAGARAG